MTTQEASRNIDFVGHTDNAGRGDGVQVMVSRGHAYIGTRVSRGVNVTDVRDPRNPRPVNLVPINKNSWCMHLQAAEDKLLVIEELDMKALMTNQEYYGSSPDRVDSRRYGKRGQDFSAGMRVYDIEDPANPRPIGFMEVEGLGLHRIWWTGGRYAYASALLDGFTDHILLIIDLADPTHPREAGRWWIPGMHADGGETKSWTNRVALHHAVVVDDIAYGSRRDGGLTILDVRDKSAPKLIAHRNWCPPFGGGTHSALPLHDRDLCVVADEATQNIDEEQMKRIWMFDIREKSNPVSIATFPIPHEQDYVAKAGSSARTICTRTGRDRGKAPPRSLRRIKARACARTISPIRSVLRRPGISFRRCRRVGRSQCAGARRCGTRRISSSQLYATDYDAGLYILQWKG
jgi:hypothetical protein